MDSETLPKVKKKDESSKTTAISRKRNLKKITPTDRISPATAFAKRFYDQYGEAMSILANE